MPYNENLIPALTKARISKQIDAGDFWLTTNRYDNYKIAAACYSQAVAESPTYEAVVKLAQCMKRMSSEDLCLLDFSAVPFRGAYASYSQISSVTLSADLLRLALDIDNDCEKKHAIGEVLYELAGCIFNGAEFCTGDAQGTEMEGIPRDMMVPWQLAIMIYKKIPDSDPFYQKAQLKIAEINTIHQGSVSFKKMVKRPSVTEIEERMHAASAGNTSGEDTESLIIEPLIEPPPSVAACTDEDPFDLRIILSDKPPLLCLSRTPVESMPEQMQTEAHTQSASAAGDVEDEGSVAHKTPKALVTGHSFM